jgi:hypothetical protein
MKDFSPAILVAILIAARKTKDRDVEQVVKSVLEVQYGIRVSFASNTSSVTTGGSKC